jgi:hypothetical protein
MLDVSLTCSYCFLCIFVLCFVIYYVSGFIDLWRFIILCLLFLSFRLSCYNVNCIYVPSMVMLLSLMYHCPLEVHNIMSIYFCPLPGHVIMSTVSLSLKLSCYHVWCIIVLCLFMLLFFMCLCHLFGHFIMFDVSLCFVCSCYYVWCIIDLWRFVSLCLLHLCPLNGHVIMFDVSLPCLMFHWPLVVHVIIISTVSLSFGLSYNFVRYFIVLLWSMLLCLMYLCPLADHVLVIMFDISLNSGGSCCYV